MSKSSHSADRPGARPVTLPESPLHVDAAVRAISEVGVMQRVRRGQSLWHDGASEGTIWVIRDGVLASATDLPAGRRSLIGFLYAGDIVLAPPAAAPPGSVRALTPSEAIRLAPQKVKTLIATTPDFAECLIAALHRQSDRLAVHCAVLGRLSGEERLIALLVEMANQVGRRLVDRIDVPLPVDREDMADYLGLNADTVSRILSRLRRDGLIEFDGRSLLHILDWERLKALAPLASAPQPQS